MTLVTIELGSEYSRIIAELGSAGKAILEAIDDGLGKAAEFAANHVVQNKISGQELNSRTGNLRRAVEGWWQESGHAIVGVREGSAVDDYKFLLGDEEVTITPKNAKSLAIPICDALTPSGVAKYSSPREVDDLFPIYREGKAPLLARRNGKRGKIRLMFVLLKSVTVKGTDALAKGVTESADDMSKSIENEIDRKI